MFHDRKTYILREPYASPEENGPTTPVNSRTTEAGMLVERNVKIPMRDGLHLYADVFRPMEEAPAPVIVVSPLMASIAMASWRRIRTPAGATMCSRITPLSKGRTRFIG